MNTNSTWPAKILRRLNVLINKCYYVCGIQRSYTMSFINQGIVAQPSLGFLFCLFWLRWVYSCVKSTCHHRYEKKSSAQSSLFPSPRKQTGAIMVHCIAEVGRSLILRVIQACTPNVQACSSYKNKTIKIYVPQYNKHIVDSASIMMNHRPDFPYVECLYGHKVYFVLIMVLGLPKKVLQSHVLHWAERLLEWVPFNC